MSGHTAFKGRVRNYDFPVIIPLSLWNIKLLWSFIRPKVSE